MANSAEKTFRNYSAANAEAYSQIRLNYHASVYDTILEYHTSTGGKLDTLLDVGCGPGTVARSLAHLFHHVSGIDASDGMIATARSFECTTMTSEPARFEVAAAEDLGENLSPPIPDSSVDLITCANAAHWFNMETFWKSAARVLKPGGSVALWTSGDIRVHPSVPNAEAIQAALDAIDKEHILPYYEPGNILVQNKYVDLVMPWDGDQPSNTFVHSTMLRKEWDVRGEFFAGQPEVGLDMIEKMMATASPITRWRDAHPNDVGTDRDVVKLQRNAIERLLHEAGVEKGKERMKGAVNGVLIVIKRS